MTTCNDLRDVLHAVSENFDWRCRDTTDGRAEITTDRVLSDAEPVKLWVRTTDTPGQLILGDGGRTVARLEEADFDLVDPLNAAFWDEALTTYRVEEAANRLYLYTEARRAAYDLHRFADALVALDGLRVLWRARFLEAVRPDSTTAQ